VAGELQGRKIAFLATEAKIVEEFAEGVHEEQAQATARS
jgi:hypothetical protein